MDAVSAQSPSFVHMFDVAFSLRICCSLVAIVRTYPRCPFLSTVSPTSLPVICLRYLSSVAKKPRYGPPKLRLFPKDCPSPTTISAPSSPGGLRRPRDMGSVMATIRMLLFLWTISEMVFTSSREPKKFGCWITRQEVLASIACSTASGNVLPFSVQYGTSFIPASFLARYVRITSRYSGCRAELKTISGLLLILLAIKTASAVEDAPSYMEALPTSMPVSWHISVWYSNMACNVPWLISG